MMRTSHFFCGLALLAALAAVHTTAASCAPVTLSNGVVVDLSKIRTHTLRNQQQIRDGTSGSYFDPEETLER